MIFYKIRLFFSKLKIHTNCSLYLLQDVVQFEIIRNIKILRCQKDWTTMELSVTANKDAIKKIKLDRITVAKKVVEIEDSMIRTNSQRQAAKETGIARSTLQYWLSRKGKTGLSPTVENFFESPDGLVFLHQLITAAQYVMSKVGPCGDRLFSLFLSLSELNKFVAGSEGSAKKNSVNMENAIIAFEKEERARLSKTMPDKNITVCEDETFHPEICLVAMEPISNFILLEKYSEKRDAASWTTNIEESLKDLNVTIIQSTSDEGSGIIKHAEDNLGVHHSPDIFHVQQDISKAMSGSLASHVRKAEIELEKASKNHNTIQEKAELSSLPIDIKKCTSEIETIKESAKEKLEICRLRQEDVKKANRSIGEIYHPYNLETGTPCASDTMQANLEKQFKIINTAAKDAKLSENCFKRINKAYRVVSKMILTIVFFWSTVKSIISELHLSNEIEKLMHENFIAAFYLKEASRKLSDINKRKKISDKSQELLRIGKSNQVWQALSEFDQSRLEKIALECAHIFQRSSSCVEGRNGYLSLRHHSMHKLSDRKLKSLTTIHNYFIKRSDGTTAAERFFGSKPKDLFRWLLDHMDFPARPAKSRSKLSMVA